MNLSYQDDYGDTQKTSMIIAVDADTTTKECIERAKHRFKNFENVKVLNVELKESQEFNLGFSYETFRGKVTTGRQLISADSLRAAATRLYREIKASQEPLAIKITDRNGDPIISNMAMAESMLNEDDQNMQDDLVTNVKDALMFLKMSGATQVPTSVVLNDFKNRGIEISLQELQDLFPQGNNFIKSVNNQYVQFNDAGSAGSPGSPADASATVADLAQKAVSKRT